MFRDSFYKSNKQTLPMEFQIRDCNTFEEFEAKFPDEMLRDDDRVGNYLEELIWKYDKDHATVSRNAGLARSYVGNIVRGKKDNPSRDALIAICLAIGTTVEEVQYLLKYAGHAPLYVRRKRDVIIWFGFMKGKSIDDVDIALYDRGYKTLKKKD